MRDGNATEAGVDFIPSFRRAAHKRSGPRTTEPEGSPSTSPGLVLPRPAARCERLPKSDDLFDEKIRDRALARIDALTAEVSVRDVTKHATNLRRIANALEAADDKASELFAAAYVAEHRKEAPVG
jgi:hypothetical protein